MNETDLLSLAQKVVEIQPQTKSEWGVVGVFFLFLVIALAGAVKGFHMILNKLLDAKDDMKGIFKEVTLVVANNTHAFTESGKKTDIMMETVKDLDETIRRSELVMEAGARHSPSGRERHS